MKNRKGMTLVELCIAIAILALVVAMTLTFTQLNREHMREAEQHNAMMEDLTQFEEYMKIWLREYDNSDYSIEGGDVVRTDSDGVDYYDSLIMKKNGTAVSTFKLVNGKVECEGLMPREFKSFTRMTFSLLKSEPESEDDNPNNYTGRVLVKCKITFENAVAEDTEDIEYYYVLHAQNVSVSHR